MKNHISKALLWTVGMMIGLMLVNVLKAEAINFTRAIIGGILMGIIDLCFSILEDKIKKNKTIQSK